MKVVKITELQKQWVAISTATAIFLCIGIFVVVLPGLKRINRIQGEVIEVRRRLEFLNQIQATRAKITEGEVWLTDKESRHQISSYLASLAKKHEIEVESITPDPLNEADKSGYTPFLLRLQATSSFSSLASMIIELSGANPRIAVEEMTISRTEVEKDEKNIRKDKNIRMDLVLKTLLLPSKNTAKPSGAPE